MRSIAVSLLLLSSFINSFGQDSTATFDTYFQQAIKYNNQGNYELSGKCFIEALKRDSTHAGAAYNAGVCLEMQKKYDEAKTYYKKAITIAPDYPAPYIGMANVCDKQDDFKGYVTYIETAFKLKPELKGEYEADKYFSIKKELGTKPTSETYVSYAKKLYEDRNTAGSIKAFENALQLNPNNGSANLNLATIYMEKNEFKKAEPLLNKALPNLKIATDKSMCYENIGYCKEKTGDKNGAIQAYLKGVEIWPTKSLYYKLSRVYESMGNMEKAKYYRTKS